MANICTTQVTIHANESTIDWLEKLVKTYMDEDYIGQFGSSDAETMIDKIGCKWMVVNDSYRSDKHEYYIAIESAWYLPDVLLKNMFAQLNTLDSGAYINGRYWDEAFCPIGIFEINTTGFHTAEIDLEVDWDDEYYWDEQVEPAFDSLEL